MTTETGQAAATGEGGVHPVRVSEILPLAFRAARALDAVARSVADGKGFTPRRTAAIAPPPPGRIVYLVVTTALALAVLPSWVVRTATEVGIVSHRPRKGSGRYRWAVKPLAGAVLLLAMWVVGFPALDRRWPSIGFVVLGVVTLLTLLWGLMTWRPLRAAWRDRAAMRTLRDEETALIRSTDGPVHSAYALASAEGWGGLALMRALVRRADESGISILARTEEALIPYYEFYGFTVVTKASTSWGIAVLVMRSPGAKRRRTRR